MSWRRFFTRVQNDADLQQQIEFHLQEQLEENLACGMNAEEARRQASQPGEQIVRSFSPR